MTVDALTMRSGWQLRRAITDEHEMCWPIAEKLPESFTASGVEALRRDLERHGALVAASDRAIIGFAVTKEKSTSIMELLWLAVAEGHQRGGVGSALLARVCDEATAAGTRVLEVKTLAAGAESAEYEVTRRFYEARGFELLEEIDPYPGWEPGNPCAIYVKPLASR
jgi:GNAT superfamily N-acetyltransferase